MNLLFYLLPLLLFVAAKGTASADPKPAAVDTWQDDEIRKVVAYAIAHETRADVLQTLEGYLAAAGYKSLSEHVDARRRQLLGQA